MPTVEVDDVVEEGDRFSEQKVAVMGDVETTLSARALVLEDLGLFSGDELLVLARSEVEFSDRPVAEYDMVRVEGIVYPYDRAVLESELGWSLPESFDDKWANKPVLLTHMVVSVYDYGRWEEGVTNRMILDENGGNDLVWANRGRLGFSADAGGERAKLFRDVTVA